jgi:hypothetical protein
VMKDADAGMLQRLSGQFISPADGLCHPADQGCLVYAQTTEATPCLDC